MPHGRALLDTIEPLRDLMVESIRLLVEHESPSLDKPALDGLARKIAGRFELFLDEFIEQRIHFADFVHRGMHRPGY